MHYGFGIDLGGTTVKLAFFDQEGQMLHKWEIPTDTSENGKRILPDIAAAVLGHLEAQQIPKNQVMGIGIAVPGPVLSDGTVNQCINLGWGVFNIQTTLSALTGLPVKAGNDANVAALGEYFQGGGKGYDSMVMVTLGTGVGGGVVLGGKVFSGSHGVATEIGHMVTVDGGEMCTCGNRGCWERYTSATAIIREGRKFAAAHPESALYKKVGGDLDKIEARTVIDLAKENDPDCMQLFENYVYHLAVGLATLVNVYDPEVIAIGGGVSHAGEFLLNKVNEILPKLIFCKNMPYARIELARMGNDAGIIGAAMLGTQEE